MASKVESADSASPAISLKLLVDTKGQRVLFAEAGKEFVDFLFHNFLLPVSAVARVLISEQQTLGCLENLYRSVETLNDAYLQSSHTKVCLLHPKIYGDFTLPPPLSSLNDRHSSVAAFTVYLCQRKCGGYFSDDSRTTCPYCLNPMTSRANYRAVSSSNSQGGYVKGVHTYMVMDDLVVKPMSASFGITLLGKFHIEDVSLLEERVVSVKSDEAVRLLKASLQSTTVLTDIFLGTKEVAKIVSHSIYPSALLL